MFSFLKKKNRPEPQTVTPTESANNLQRLDEYGELPWGWHNANKEFTDRLETEYKYFSDLWYDSKESKNPKEELPTLKSFIGYMEDVIKLCKQKGETYEFWCNEYLIGAGFLQRQKNRLVDLETNMDAKMKEYEDWNEKQIELKAQEIYEATLTDEMMFDAIRQNEGVLQKDLCKLFPYPKAIANKLYWMAREGKIDRIKSGSSYILKVK